MSGERVSHCTIRSCYNTWKSSINTIDPKRIEKNTFIITMAKQFDSIDEPPKKKASLCSCVCNFLIWLFPVCLALGVALYFSPNERVVDIITFF